MSLLDSGLMRGKHNLLSFAPQMFGYKCRSYKINGSSYYWNLFYTFAHLFSMTWWNASVSKQHYGHMTSCSFPVIGDKFGTEVVVKLIRNNGAPSSFIHNTIGTGKWFIMDCHAVLPGKGGLPKILRLTDNNDSYRKSVSYFTFASLFQSIQLD